MEVQHFEVQARVKGQSSWFRQGVEWTVVDDARDELEMYEGPLYEGFRKTHDLRLARVTTVRTTEEIQ